MLRETREEGIEMETARDLFDAYCTGCGSATPTATLEDVRDEFHRRGYGNYRHDGPQFIEEIFEDGWASDHADAR
jgi:hypothetical protein